MNRLRALGGSDSNKKGNENLNPRPNVILIVMDTVRADHLSCYGYHRITSPNIDKIARYGVLFKNAFSAAPWTPPSHASILTGKYPSYHKTLGKDIRFKKENTSLAEILTRNGYQSIGITCCPILGLGSGFEKGFHEFIELNPYRRIGSLSLSSFKLRELFFKDRVRNLIYGPDKRTYEATEVIKSFVKRNMKERPFFLFVNYFNCHTPYGPPRPFSKRFCSSFDESRFYIKEFLLNRILQKTADKISNRDLDIQKLKWIASGEGGFSFAAKQTSVSDTEWQVVKSWYDGEIAYLDYRIGNLVDFLHNKGIFNNTVLIITSDHGENFGEHGLAVHPLCVYDELLHVPLIMSYPNLISREKKISNLMSTVDIFPTVMDLLGIKFGEEIQGKSAYPFEDREIHNFICAEYGGLHKKSLGERTKSKLEEIDRGCKCIRNLTYKYIWKFSTEELYNIRDDPLEQVNIATEHPKMVRHLRKQLEETVDMSFFGPKEFSYADEKGKETMKRLKALGYI